MKCVIFAGRPVGECLRGWWRDADLVIAADAGYETARRLGVRPDVLLGDYDSAPCPRDAAALVLPAEKDDTDTHFAAREAIRRGAAEVVILGGLGGRLDHTLANFATLLFLAQNGVRARLVDEATEAAALVPGTYEIPARPDRYFSIFPAGEKAGGVWLEGLKYPLREYTLTNAFPIGVSNEFVEKTATLRFRSGAIFLVLSRRDEKR